LLGCFGHADAGKRVLESGVDLLYTSHQVNAELGKIFFAHSVHGERKSFLMRPTVRLCTGEVYINVGNT
jgi:hypothetical protein